MTATLIITPNHEWASKAQNYFISKGMGCEIALTGKEAQLKAYHTSFDYFFLDLEVTNHSAIEVCKYLRKARPQAHVFVTIAREEVLNELLLTEQGLMKLGVHKVIFKPEPESLLSHIQG